MSKLHKILFGSALLLFALSYPLCQVGERKAKSEMARYPPEFVQAHEFDMVFGQYVLPGIFIFLLAGILFFAAIVHWIVERILDRPKPRSPKS